MGKSRQRNKDHHHNENQASQNNPPKRNSTTASSGTGHSTIRITSSQSQNPPSSTLSNPNQGSGVSDSNPNVNVNVNINSSLPIPSSHPSTLLEWCYAERHGLFWVLGCAFLGMLLGLGIGTGHLTGAAHMHSPWRIALASKIRHSFWYRVLTLRETPWAGLISILREIVREGPNHPMKHGSDMNTGAAQQTPNSILNGESGDPNNSPNANLKNILDPNHPHTFHVLREMIIREEGGYVHPDLGFLNPAPSGTRGIGMITDRYQKCLLNCPTRETLDRVLLKIPLECQMTRSLALRTLLPLLPHDVRRRAPLEDLDDAALLVLLLSHERGRGRESRFQAYITTLPKEPTCGYSPNLRSQAIQAVHSLGHDFGLDVNGWPAEIVKAADYAERIAGALTRDYGNYIAVPRGMSAFNLISWSICQIANRATAGNEDNGALRLVPVMDLINHDAEAGGMVELTGEEHLNAQDFIDVAYTTERDSGMFVVTSLRNGRKKYLRKGMELMVNYNVPEYSPLDWFINMGFIPPERIVRWVKVDGVLPRVRSPDSGLDAGITGAGSTNPGDKNTLTVVQTRPEL